MVELKAIWDTGATNSMITGAVVTACHLLPIDTMTTHHALGTTEDVEVFLINIGLPNKVAIPELRVARGSPRGTDVLIGMDIINHGDFAVTNRRGMTKFTFRIPSQADIDFVAEDKKSALLGGHPLPSERTRQKNRQQRRKK